MGSWLYVPNQAPFVPISFLPSGANVIKAVTPLNDGSGKLYVGGNFTSYKGVAINRIMRLNSDASIDTSFNVGTGFVGNVQVIAKTTDGSNRIYVGGNFTSYNGTSITRIARINPNGSLDTSFDPVVGPNAVVLCMAVTNDGSNQLYIGGQFITYNGTSKRFMVRLNSNGSLDTSWAPVIGNTTNPFVNAMSLAVDGSGDLYIGGAFTQINAASSNCVRIARINSNGTLDAGFATGVGANQPLFAIIALNDGTFRIAGGGDFTSVSGATVGRLGCVVPGGVGQGGFNSGTGCNNTVRTVVELAGGGSQLIFTGAFTTYNGSTNNRIIKVTSNTGTGGQDFTYRSNIGSGFDANVQMSAQDSSGKLYAVGDFANFNGIARDRLLRLNADGTIDTTFA